MPADARRDAQRRVTAVIGTALLHTRWLRRLGRISFLGTLDGHPRSRGASTRLEHSIGVAALGVDAAEALQLSRERSRELVAACLLHDVGHYPLSHAAESAFTEVLGADHHRVSDWITRGGGPIPHARSLGPTLERLQIDPERVWRLIDGSEEGSRALNGLLHGRINLDTLDGVPRAAAAFRVSADPLPAAVFAWHDDELAIADAAVPALDAFWGLKDRVYDEVINLPSNVLAEARLCEVVKRRITSEVFERFEYFDDRALVRALGDEHVRLDAADDQSYTLRSRDSDDAAAILVRMRKRYRVDPAESVSSHALADSSRARDGTHHRVDPSSGGGEAEPSRIPVSRWSARYRHDRVPGYLISRDRQLPLPGLGTPPPVFEAPEIE